MPESSDWIYSLQSVLTPVTIWATCFAFFFFLNDAPYYLSFGTDGIFNHLPLQRKIYVLCLGQSFDLKGWWVEMSTLHCVNFGYQHASRKQTKSIETEIYQENKPWLQAHIHLQKSEPILETKLQFIFWIFIFS